MKNAIITGGTSGIGLGIARLFAAQGYNLLLNGLEKYGQQIADELAQEHDVKVMFSSANMQYSDQIREMVQQAEQEFGQIDVLINNAGIQYVAPVDEFPEDRWDAIIAINMSATFHASKAVWPGMKARGFGRIINIASAHALRASEFKVAYVAAKHGVAGITKVLALEGAPYGITCNAICPGYVRTPLVEAQIADQARAHQMSETEVIEKVMLKKQPIKQFVEVEALGNLALYLASDAASQLTGAMLPVDGGWSAQ
ncbi:MULTISPECIES: 3-hydroxybutyrate dehydrogenase [Pontibacter]|uniref:3-hydroxybutyrate dehydrogenase n=1 Tax=Pontibacter lucknowensis TaxID=1077936 RepID=A0A1N6UWG3_9BACT|nr:MULTISPECIES: 3-hydroxybutyrate dehydrogenase [Pontibacter]EJF10463.1 D(-)-3-hydroxybutyrate dehydrogenase [Pontibacter sp. BAB1700]SIQ69908.1 3-hydroxybutyrate dehydrogenase [Pontibacter lucknowensis]